MLHTGPCARGIWTIRLTTIYVLVRKLSLVFSSYSVLARILTSLGQLGFAEWKEPLVKFLEEQIKIGELENCKQSFERFWKETLNTETKKYDLNCQLLLTYL